MSQGYNTSNITILGPEGSDSKSLRIGPTEMSGELEAKGFNNCPFCMKTDELALTWEKMITTTPSGIEYIFDVTLLCRGCGVMMDENGLDMAGAISSLHERWNKRPSRDDFSRELLKARMYDKQEAWMKSELAKWGPFSMEQMEQYFDKSMYEMLAGFISLMETVEKQHKELGNARAYVQHLNNQMDALRRGDAETTKKLERMFLPGSGNTGGGSIGSAYFNGQSYPIIRGNINYRLGDGQVYWTHQDIGTWEQMQQESVRQEAYRNAMEGLQRFGQMAGESFKQFAEGLTNAIAPDSSTLEKLEEIRKQIQDSPHSNELNDHIDKESRRAEREESKRKAILRSQRNQQHLTEDKKRKR